MELSILDLWQPILLSTFLAWIASAVIHMALKYHNFDYRQLKNEDEVRDAIRSGSPSLGIHSVPFCADMKQMGEESMQKKFSDGPVALVTILPNGMPNMGKLIGQQILYFLFGCVIIAYCATLSVMPDAEYLAVFQVVCPVAFLAFGWSVIPYSIWYGHPWAVAFRYLIDATIYALITAGSFAWLWPAAA